MKNKIGDRVIAFESFKDGVLTTYGEGVYLGDKVPDATPFNTRDIPNPCIRLDSGKHIWGYQCWWGSPEEIDEKYGQHITKILDVDPEVEVLPKTSM